MTLSADNKSEGWVLAWWDGEGGYMWSEEKLNRYLRKYPHDPPTRILLRSTNKEEVRAMYRLAKASNE